MVHLVGNTALVAAALATVEVVVAAVEEEDIVDCMGSRTGTPRTL